MANTPYRIQLQDSFIYIRFKGGTEITPEMLMEVVDREIDLDHGERRNDLWDFRDCWASAEFKYDTMQMLVEHIEERLRFHWKSRTALLVDQDAAYGLARMFQVIAESLSYSVGVFREINEAEEYIRP